MPYRFRLALRLPAIIFFLLTAWFGLLSYIPFAYLQFLRHLLFAWLEFFVLFHHWLFWSAFFLALLSIADDLRARRIVAWAFAAVFGTFGVWLLLHPVLPSLVNDRRSLLVAMVALAAPVWLAAIDHSPEWKRIASLAERSPGDIVARALRTCLGTALYVWTCFSVIAGIRMARAEVHTSAIDHLGPVGWSLFLHIVVGAAVFFYIAAVFLLLRKPRAQYVAIMTGLAVLGFIVLSRLVFPSIAFRGTLPNVIGALFGASGAFIWSGLVMRRIAEVSAQDPLDIALSPFTMGRSFASAAALVVLAAAAYVATEMVARADWYFLFQKLIACVTWVAAFGVIYSFDRAVDERPASSTAARPSTDTRVGSRGWDLAVSLVIVLGIMLVASGAPSSRWSFAIDRLIAYDASLALIDQLTKPTPTELGDLTRLMIEHSDLESQRAQPTSVDFVEGLRPSGAWRPHIFVFVIDSLRRDYLSAYNAAVNFTPSIASFARESIVFRRAFTRYGGTGLSEPAIWSGAMLPHKQYVTPFAPMNALEKLLDAEGYRRLISVDSILTELLTPSSAIRELDAGIQNRLYDACRTLDEIRTVLPGAVRDGQPVFAFTQSQDIHLANVAVDRSRRDGHAYGPFYVPYAGRLQRLDACFGQFIKYLKESGLYDSSIIVLTSDHGDSLGDEGRWGHAFTVFPEVIQVPLIVHVPARLQKQGSTDPDAVAFTTDITPTLYKLLGHEPVVRDPLFGMALIGIDHDTIALRRRHPYLVASSYGPVYGVVSQNGEKLYIVDAVNTAEHHYDLTIGLNGKRTIVTAGERTNALQALQAQMAEVASFYER